MTEIDATETESETTEIETIETETKRSFLYNYYFFQPFARKKHKQ